MLSWFLGIALVASAHAQTQLWVGRYNGPGNSSDEATKVVTDGSGNVYVTGSSSGSGSQSDFATVKYDTAGHQIWAKRYNGPANGADNASGLAVDSLGNVYVTGTSTGSGSNTDYATVKYDLAGNEIWVQRYNGPANGADNASGLALDSLGNVCVTGNSVGIGTQSDYATVKYDPMGNQVWVRRYTGVGLSGDDLARALSVDSSGNIYVTGTSARGGVGTTGDYATVKYSAAGNQIWAQRYNGSANGADNAYGLAVDLSGNVYVTGSAVGIGTMVDYATVKYDSVGSEVWVRIYNGPASNNDGALALSLDSSSNVYVTGNSVGPGPSLDYATVKYDTAGNQIWVQRYGDSGSNQHGATALAVDPSGYVFVTGFSIGSSSQSDYVTVKYDPSGNQLWMKRYDGPADGEDAALALALDPLGNAYVTGRSYDTGSDYDYLTIKYSLPNTEPTAVDDGPYPFEEDGSTMVGPPGVLANDTDPENNPLMAILVSGPAHAASFSLSNDGAFDYRPNANYNGPDSFTYRVFDGIANSNIATVFITVNAVNDGPILIVPGNQSTPQNVLLTIHGISLSDIDSLDGQLTVQIGTAHARLTLPTTAGLTFSLGDGSEDRQMTFSGSLAAVNAALASVNYEADANFVGADTVDLSVSDNGNSGSGGALTDSGQISVQVSDPVYEDIYPFAYRVDSGEEFTGGLSDLFLSDDSKLTVFNDAVDLTAEIVFDGQAPSATGCELRFVLESSVERRGIAQYVSFFNWQTQAWNFVAGTVATTTDAELELRTVLVSAYVKSDGSVRAKATWGSINDEDPTQDGWLHNIDVAKWVLVD